MQLSLYIAKKCISPYAQQEKHAFVIVDLDKAESYPQNFVCVLPRLRLTATADNTFKCKNIFLSMFKDQSLQIAKTLLTTALDKRPEPGVVGEIEQRLKDLEPKPALKANCILCGAVFESRAYNHHRQRICQACISKPIPMQQSTC
jgi:hypothetical protein